ncbi:MAG: NAD(P)H-hydrate dehydratase [Bacteroidia bacterium]|nr:NAD(P)H-hydrate dehydratase [Bacteroidia bacterium]NNF31296.1 NAD(P)H-hydrate dehydratase [Flavobacteriaceae bacterium]MBT8274612.1 NAD(P)H-hydrate dehydratase [Bacteroidia bacterium]NNJ82126.1 NAD(P)H-hydrate dehydratase [Flavobacteriaceae bacterium]NNK54218.1 NAD(P)H-hydrate dehydratase [Flavobacteriaceae bacterium]
MKVFSATQLHEADKVTTEKDGITPLDLMERAGTMVFNWLHQRMQGAQVPVHIFCGIGNNGGDGLVVGRLLIEHGYSVHIYIANFTDKRSKCFLLNYDRIKKVTSSWPTLMTSEADFPEIHQDDVVIDAIFGIGLNRAPEGWVKKLIQYLNNEKAFRLSIDIPSGLHANKPIADKEAVLRANHTLTFQAPKLAFFLPESGQFVPYFETIDIGLDPEFLHQTEPLARLISKAEAQQFYKQRKKYSHKGDYGHVVAIGGSHGKIGAVVLASKAAYRSGAGLVTAFIPSCGYETLQTAVPEAMAVTDKDEEIISDISGIPEATAFAVGMGLGTDERTVDALKKFFKETKAPMVIDADAINCIANNKELKTLLPKQSVLTPHPGELRRLIGDWSDDYDKLAKTKAFAKEHECIVLIKGANSITVSEDKLYVNTSGNPGMATGGSGDVLSGMIAGLLAQGYDPLSAAIFATYIHGSAGNIVSQTNGFEAVMAGDIADHIGKAFLILFEPDAPVQTDADEEA